MEQYKTTLKRRLYGVAGYCAALVALICLGLFHPAGGDSEEINAFLSGFNVGLAFVAVGMAVIMVVKYAAALKDEAKLKALYIVEHDERLGYIHCKMGGTAMQIVLYGLLAATITAGFFSQTVFFTLLGTLLFKLASNL